MAANPLKLDTQLKDKIYQLVAGKDKYKDCEIIKERRDELINMLQSLNEFIRTPLKEVILNQSLTSLNLAICGLTAKGLEKTTDLFTLTNVTSLNLGRNRLFKLKVKGLTNVFHALPTSVTSLNLEGNRLHELGAEDLANVIGELPASVTSLNFGNNHLSDLNVESLSNVFAVLPASVTSLNLGSNYLHELNAEGLAKVFAALPVSVKSLNLGYNQLHKLDAEGLKKAVEVLRGREIELIWDGNNLSDELINEVQRTMESGFLTKAVSKKVTLFQPADHGSSDKANSTVARATGMLG